MVTGGMEPGRLLAPTEANGENIGGPVSDAEQHFSDPPQNPVGCIVRVLSPGNAGSLLARAVSGYRDGGLMTALATDAARIDGLWVVGFSALTERFAGSRYSLNPVRRAGNEWRSATLRLDKHSVRTKGVASFWVSEDNRRCIVAYRDGPELLKAIELWGVPIVVLQHLQRALNGNGTSAAEVRRQAKAEELDAEVPFDCKTCGKAYTLTRREMNKTANHKAKLAYYGLDLCVSCRDLACEIQRVDGSDPAAVAAAVDAGLLDAPRSSISYQVGSVLDAARSKVQRAVAPLVTRPRVQIQEDKASSSSSSVPDADEEITEGSEYARMSSELRDRGGDQCGPYEDGDGDRDGQRCWHMAGTVRVGDYILTREFCEPYSRNELLPYHRVGKKLERVVVNDVEYPSNDWMFDPVPISNGMRAVVLEKSAPATESKNAGIPWVLFKIEASTHESVPVRHRFSQYRYKRAYFTWFRGSTISEVCIEGSREYVPSAVLGESMRYYANESNARTSSSHIMGQLKLNERLSGRQIDYIIRLCCAVHDNRAVPYARAVAGDAHTTERVAREMNNTRLAWWMPRFVSDCWEAATTEDSLWYVRVFFWLLVLCAVSAAVNFGFEAFGLAVRVLSTVKFEDGFGFGLNGASGSLLHHFDSRRERVVADGSASWQTRYYANCTEGEVRGLNCSHISFTESEFTSLWLMGGVGSRNCMHKGLNGEYKTKRDEQAREGVLHSMNSSEAIRDHGCRGAAQVEMMVAAHYDAFRKGLSTGDRTWLLWYEEVFRRWHGIEAPEVFAYWVHQICFGSVQVLFLAPVWEEWVKHVRLRPFLGRGPTLGLLCTMCICFIEWFGFISKHGTGLIWAYLPTLYMHFATHALPFHVAVVYHMTFNWVIMRHFLLSEFMSMYAMSFTLLWDAGLGAAACAWLRYMYGITYTPGAVGSGGFLGLGGVAAAVLAYNRGGSSRFPRVKPSGADSEFERFFDDPEFRTHFPMKDHSKVFRKLARGKNPKNELTQLMPEFVPITSFAANRANTLHSLAGRVLKDTPPVVRSTDGVVSALDSMSKKMGVVEPDSEEDWAAKFPPVKRTRYQLSFVRLAIFGLAAFGDTLLGASNPWFKRSCFLKHEVNLCLPDKVFATRNGKYRVASSDPRTIQASTDEVQAALGRYFTAYGRRASAVFDGSEASEVLGWRVVMAFGRSKSDVAAIMLELAKNRQNAIVDCGDDGYLVFDGKIVAIDAARWDAHVSATLLRLKSRHLLQLGMPKGLVDILDRMVLRVGGFKRRGIRFEVLGDVASGDPDTLYWNTFLGVAVLLDSVRGCTTFEEVAARTKSLGIEYEVAATNTRTEAGSGLDFCSCTFVPSQDVGGFTLAPKLGRALMKLSGTATNGNPAKLLASKIGGLCYDLCVFPEVVASLRKLLPELPHAKPISESYFPVGKSTPSVPERRDSYLRERYGVTLAEVETDVGVWVDRARRGDMEAGDLVSMRKMVAVDYGKAPMATRGWFRGAVMLGVLCCCATGGDGGSIVSAGGLVGRNLFPEQTLSYQRHTNIMAGKGNKKGGAQPPKFGSANRPREPKKKRQTAKSHVNVQGMSGDGLYRLLAPLAKAAVSAAMPRALQAAGSRLMPSAARFSGSGDYVTNDIVHMGGGHPIGKGVSGVPVTKYQHSEYIRDIVVPAAPAAFTSLKFNINAADSGTFPWLSRLASLYTKYKFTKLLFEFRTTTSNYSAAGSLGTVVMAPHYNVDSQQFPTKQAMEASTHAVSSAPSNSIIMGFECAKVDANVSWYNVLNDGTIARGNFTDAGYVEVSTTGLPGVAGTTLGELWVHYACDLIEPYVPVSDTPASAAKGTVSVYQQSGSNLANAMVNGVFGFQYSAMNSLTSDDFPVANQGVSVRATAVPSTSDWFTWCSADAGKQLGFRYGGTYILELKHRITGPPTTATGPPYEVSALAGTLTVISGNTNNPAPIVWSSGVNATAWGYRWVVTVSDGAILTTTLGTGWTGVSTYAAVFADLSVTKIS